MSSNKSETTDSDCELRLLGSLNQKKVAAKICDQTNNEATSSNNKKMLQQSNSKKNNRCCGNIALLAIGLCNLILAILTIRFPIFKQLMKERLKMTPGLPAFDLWYTLPTKANFNVYIFNITNSDKVLNGSENKLNVQEIGPLKFRENLVHKDVEFHKNSTMSFTATRSAEFVMNDNYSDILKKEIIVPNLLSLGMASYMHDGSSFSKFGLKLLLSGEPAFKKVTIEQYLWNITSPLIKMGKTFVPFLFPMDNIGIINIIYNNFTDRANVNIGPKYGNSEFFLLNTYNGKDKISGFEDSRCDSSFANATEGVIYPQFLTHDTVLRYWRKTHCKILPLHFQEESKVGLLNTYKFILMNNSYDRPGNMSHDCHAGNPRLPSGLIDVSKCTFGFPVAASFPHFFAGDNKETQILRDQVTGLNPNEQKHRSFIKVEPITGIPISQCARSQSNLVIHKLFGFGKDIDKMSEKIIPMFWAEYCLPTLPAYLIVLIFVVANILPVLEILLPVVFLITTILILGTIVYRQLKTINQKSPKTNYSNFIRIGTGLFLERVVPANRATP